MQTSESLIHVPSFELFSCCFPIFSILFYLNILYFVIFYYYPLETCLLYNERHKVDSDGKGDEGN